MTKIKLLAGLAIATAMMTACDDTTDTIGNSLTSHTDLFDITADTFEVHTRSVVVDSVLSRSQYSYLGHVKDPETGTYVTSSYTTQFSVLENLDGSSPFLPKKDSIRSFENGMPVADSCTLRINVESYTGNQLTPMKLTACEMESPVTEGKSYYTNYDPEAAGLLRKDANAIRLAKSYTPIDQNLSDSIRNELTSSSTTHYIPINIPLNGKYTDRNGREYKNYGTYIMQMYYEHPEYFKNSNTFRYHVCPGFYIKHTGGLGVMAKINSTDLIISFRSVTNDSIANSGVTLAGTEEVMQTTTIVNDKKRMALLADDNTCTYLKTPAGIYTEVELPVENIMKGHETDTLSSAKIIFSRINASGSDYEFGEPTTIMILPKDSIYSFFENRDLPDNKLSYIGTYNSSYNTYTFNNISSMIGAMYQAKKAGKASADWNKAVLIPVEQTTSTSGSSYTSTTKVIDVSNEMSLKSTKLVGGSANPHQPITISVIYNKFKDN